MGLPIVGQKALGFRTFFGTWVAPGARVTFLGPAGVFEDTFTENNRVATLNAALARCRSGKGDVIFVLPGYTEAINAADFATSLVAGTQIIGVAPFMSSIMPTWHFTATTATILLDVADVLVRGMKFTCGIDAVANYLTVSAAGCAVEDCYLQTGTSSSLDVTIPVIVAAGGNDFRFENNRVAGTSTAVNTNAISVTGAVDGLRIQYNDFDIQAAGATNGVIEFSAAATQFRIHKNNIVNRRATAAVSVRWTDVALSGIISENNLAFAADITVASAALSAAGSTTHLVRAFDNLGHDENIGSAIASTIGAGATIE
jgi:hypothetical protein